VLTPQEAAEFTQRVRDGSTPTAPIDVNEGILGYRGFIVRATGAEAESLGGKGHAIAFRVRSGVPGVTTDLSAEQFLLQGVSGSSGLTDAEASAVSEQVMWDMAQSSSPDQAALAAAGVCSLYYTSWDDFSFWNGTRKPDNNCYNYAANYASNTFAQPGRQGGQIFTALTVSAIKAAMQRDGWVLSCDTSNLRVALVIWPGVDYHFYRKNLNDAGASRWCHKPGQTNARNKDNSGNYITNPENCDRGPYTTWGGGHVFSNGVRSRVVR
jgi:hypothetical protein